MGAMRADVMFSNERHIDIAKKCLILLYNPACNRGNSIWRRLLCTYLSLEIGARIAIRDDRPSNLTTYKGLGSTLMGGLLESVKEEPLCMGSGEFQI
jgi:hypothetical protein